MSNLVLSRTAEFLQVEGYDDRGNFFFKDGKDYAGVVFEVTPINGTDSRLASIISTQIQDCADSSVLQFTLLTLPDFDAPQAYAHGKDKGNEISRRMVVNKSKLLESLSKDFRSNLPILNTKRLFITMALPVEERFVATKEFQNRVNEFKVGLKSIFGDVVQADPAYYRHILQQCANPLVKAEFSPRFDLQENFNAQVFDDSNTFDFTTDVSVGTVDGKTKYKIITPIFFPEEVPDAFMYKVLGLPFEKALGSEDPAKDNCGDYKLKIPNIQSVVLQVCDQQDTFDSLKDAGISLKNDEIGRQSAGAVGFFLKKLQIGSIDTNKTIQEIEALVKAKAGKVKYVKTSYSAVLFCDDEEKLQDEATAFRNHLRSPALGFEAQVVSNGTHGPRFVNALPLNHSIGMQAMLSNDVLMTSNEAAALLPVYANGTSARYLEKDQGMGLIAPLGELVFFSPFRGSISHNGFVSGGSGGGKSFTLCEFIQAKIAAGAKVYVFDNGESFKKLAIALGGNFVNFKADDLPSLNPFPDLVGDAEAIDRESELLAVLLLRIAYPQGEIVPTGSELAVKQAIKASMKTKASSLEDSLSADSDDYLHSLENVIAALESGRNTLMSEGSGDSATTTQRAAMEAIAPLKDFNDDSIRGKLFKGKSQLDLTNRLNVFEFKGISTNSHLRSIIVFFLMSRILNDINNSDDPNQEKIMIVDEAQDLFGEGSGDELEAKIMDQMFRKLRKEKGAMWICAQDMTTFLERKSAGSIFNNAPWRIYLPMPMEAVDKLFEKKLLSEDPHMKRTLMDMSKPNSQYGEFVLHENSSGFYQKLRLYTDKFAQAIYSTSDDYRYLKDVENIVESAEEAIGDKSRKVEQFIKETKHFAYGSYGLSKKEMLDLLKQESWEE